MIRKAFVSVLLILLALSCSKKEPASSQAAPSAENEVSQKAASAKEQGVPETSPKAAKSAEVAGPGAAGKAPESQAPPEAAKRPYKTQSRSGGYTGVLITARRRARETAALLGIRQAIQAFRATNGRLPADLDELKKDYDIPEPPGGLEYGYEPKTGEINLYYREQEQPGQ